MQCSHLTDDELWCAIRNNTNEISALFDPSSTSARFSNSRAIYNLEQEYQDYAGELLRRHLPVLNSGTPTRVGSDQAA
jgi:hypothetical protein